MKKKDKSWLKMFLYGSKYYKTKHQDKLKMLKIY